MDLATTLRWAKWSPCLSKDPAGRGLDLIIRHGIVHFKICHPTRIFTLESLLVLICVRRRFLSGIGGRGSLLAWSWGLASGHTIRIS
jgi:hypothetical protein